MKKEFWLKNHTCRPPNDLNFQYVSNMVSMFEILFNLKFYHQGAMISEGPKRPFLAKIGDLGPSEILAPLWQNFKLN